MSLFINKELDKYLKNTIGTAKFTILIYILLYSWPLAIYFTEPINIYTIFYIFILVIILNFVFIYKVLYKIHLRNRRLINRVLYTVDKIELISPSWMFNSEKKFIISREEDYKLEKSKEEFNGEYEMYLLTSKAIKVPLILIPTFFDNWVDIEKGLLGSVRRSLSE